MPIAKDIWRPLVLEAPIEAVLRAGTIAGFPHHWLPEEGFLRFLADPFGLERRGQRFVFAELYDYRTRHGTIDCLHFDGHRLVERRQVLAEPWHLSYPYVFEAEGETYMLPEAHRSGGLTLYRAVEFPWRWERAVALALDHVAVDATPFFHDGLWWLFHAAADDAQTKTGALFLAFAERLAGPWRPHPGNPVRRGTDSTRPGGTPVMIDGNIVLPVQDCRLTYGGAIRPLVIGRLDPDHFEAEAGPAIVAPAAFAPFDAGLHTLSAMGGATLVDVKRRLLSPRSLAVLAKRELTRR
ncbi:glucosamine inositolphosphorylceramide transferase family protein [Sphingomonas abietis]|uniref:Formyl transferase n=1 Tax=Sphingomonas abietis TaxID=3012344 RepID=A0ABY7NIZ4_9SPHN|nr:formyl transferase [Sphingomonas abietis]WBO21505.1 formyl transferase [Sphingomonas abietis]